MLFIFEISGKIVFYLESRSYKVSSDKRVAWLDSSVALATIKSRRIDDVAEVPRIWHAWRVLPSWSTVFSCEGRINLIERGRWNDGIHFNFLCIYCELFLKRIYVEKRDYFFKVTLHCTPNVDKKDFMFKKKHAARKKKKLKLKLRVYDIYLLVP